MERKNIFLHFLNRDIRDIYRLITCISRRVQIQWLYKAIVAATLLCKNYSIFPVSVTIEDQNPYGILQNFIALCHEGLLRISMRENSFGDYLEKKRAEYSSHSELYKGYFNDNFEKELNKISAPVVHRDIKIGKEISIRWKQDLEEYSDKTIWRNILDQESSGKL